MYSAGTGLWTTSSIGLDELDGAPLPPCSPSGCSGGNPAEVPAAGPGLTSLLALLLASLGACRLRNKPDA